MFLSFATVVLPILLALQGHVLALPRPTALPPAFFVDEGQGRPERGLAPPPPPPPSDATQSLGSLPPPPWWQSIPSNANMMMPNDPAPSSLEASAGERPQPPPGLRVAVDTGIPSASAGNGARGDDDWKGSLPMWPEPEQGKSDSNIGGGGGGPLLKYGAGAEVPVAPFVNDRQLPLPVLEPEVKRAYDLEDAKQATWSSSSEGGQGSETGSETGSWTGSQSGSGSAEKNSEAEGIKFMLETLKDGGVLKYGGLKQGDGWSILEMKATVIKPVSSSSSASP